MIATQTLRPFFARLGGAFLLLGLAANVSGENTEARRTFVVTSSFDQPPYATRDAEGTPSGFDVDLVKAVAVAAGMEVTFEARGPNPEKTPDVVLGATYSDVAKPGISLYGEPHSTRDHAVFVREDSLYRNIRDLAGRNLVVPTDSAALPWLESHGFSSGLVRAESPADAFRLLAGTSVEAVVCDRYQGLDALKGGDFENLRVLPDSIAAAQYGFALTHPDTALADALNAGLRIAENTGQTAKLRAKWLSSLDPAEAKISLGGAYSVLLWLIIPGVLLCVGAALNTLSFRKRTALRIAALEQELAESRQAFRDLTADRARQRYVINALSTVSLVDQLVEASRH